MITSTQNCNDCSNPYPGADGVRRCRIWSVTLPFESEADKHCREFEPKNQPAPRCDFCGTGKLKGY